MKANFETGLKVCSRCKRELSLDNFSRDSRQIDKLNCRCRDCVSNTSKKYRQTEAGKEALKRSSKKYCENHKEKVKERQKIYRQTHIKTESQILREKEYHRIWDSRYLKTEKGREVRKRSCKKWRSSKLKDYRRCKYKEDINYKIITLARGRLRYALKNSSKKLKTLDLLGCSLEDLRKHLENQFVEGMTWDNYGSFWDVDHIIPCSYFDLTKEENQRICLNFRNLQPLLKEENRFIKRDNVPENVEELVEFLRRII